MCFKRVNNHITLSIVKKASTGIPNWTPKIRDLCFYHNFMCGSTSAKQNKNILFASRVLCSVDPSHQDLFVPGTSLCHFQSSGTFGTGHNWPQVSNPTSPGDQTCLVLPSHTTELHVEFVMHISFCRTSFHVASVTVSCDAQQSPSVQQ